MREEFLTLGVKTVRAADAATQVNSGLGVLVALVLLAAVAAGVWVVFKGKAVELTVQRLRGENEDYVRRLNYVEPQLEHLKNENGVLRSMVNPATEIHEMREQENAHHDEQMRVLRSIERNTKRTP